MPEEAGEKEEGHLEELNEARRNDENKGEKEDGAKAKRPTYIGEGEMWLIIFVAVFFDVLTGATSVAFINSIFGGIGWFVYYLWLKIKTMQGAPRLWLRLLTGTGIIELIPVIGGLPTFIALSITIILLDRGVNIPLLGKYIAKAERAVKV